MTPHNQNDWAGPYANLPAPPEVEYSDAIYEKWVWPFMHNLGERQHLFITNLRVILNEIDDEIIVQLLGGAWRPKHVAGLLTAVLTMGQHTETIGNLLLRSDTCFAGQGYALALARINTKESIEYLLQYLEHYLRRPEHMFDQREVLGAVEYCDMLNGTNVLSDFNDLWLDFDSHNGNRLGTMREATERFRGWITSIVEISDSMTNAG